MLCAGDTDPESLQLIYFEGFFPAGVVLCIKCPLITLGTSVMMKKMHTFSYFYIK